MDSVRSVAVILVIGTVALACSPPSSTGSTTAPAPTGTQAAARSLKSPSIDFTEAQRGIAWVSIQNPNEVAILWSAKVRLRNPSGDFVRDEVIGSPDTIEVPGRGNLIQLGEAPPPLPPRGLVHWKWTIGAGVALPKPQDVTAPTASPTSMYRRGAWVVVGEPVIDRGTPGFSARINVRIRAVEMVAKPVGILYFTVDLDDGRVELVSKTVTGPLPVGETRTVTAAVFFFQDVAKVPSAPTLDVWDYSLR